MKTWIGYTTKHGSTKNMARTLAQHLDGDVVLCDLKLSRDDQGWRSADRIVLGGPLYAGRLPRALRTFLAANTQELCARAQETGVGLFLCGMQPAKEAAGLFETLFGAPLVASSHTAFLGGAWDFSDMNWFERTIVRKVSGQTENRSLIRDEEIVRLAGALGPDHD